MGRKTRYDTLMLKESLVMLGFTKRKSSIYDYIFNDKDILFLVKIQTNANFLTLSIRLINADEATKSISPKNISLGKNTLENIISIMKSTRDHESK